MTGRRPARRRSVESGSWLRSRAGGALPSHMIGRNAEATRYELLPGETADPAAYAPAAALGDYEHERAVARYIAAVRSRTSL